MAQLSEPQFDNVPAQPLTGAAAAAHRGNDRRATLTPMGTRRGISQPEDAHRPRAARRPFLLGHDMLLVRNVDDVSWNFRWDRRSYVVRPGEELPIPFAAVANMMGDPRSEDKAVVKYSAETGDTGLIPSRYDQLAMLFARYGIVDEDVDALVGFAPKIEVRTMTNDPVTFPAQNPDMDPWPVPHAQEPGREAPIDQRELIDQMRAENTAMRAEIARLGRAVDERLGGESFADPDEPLPDAAVSGAVVDEGPRTRR